MEKRLAFDSGLVFLSVCMFGVCVLGEMQHQTDEHPKPMHFMRKQNDMNGVLQRVHISEEGQTMHQRSMYVRLTQ